MSERKTPEINGPATTNIFRPYRSARYPAAGCSSDDAKEKVIAREAASAIERLRFCMSRGRSGLRNDA
jgi:hypothetical protein